MRSMRIILLPVLVFLLLDSLALSETPSAAHELERYYYPSGTLRSIQSFSGGKRDGLCIWYYETGKEEARIEYKNDKQHGTSIWFNPDGSIRAKAYYVDGIRQNFLDRVANYLPSSLSPTGKGIVLAGIVVVLVSFLCFLPFYFQTVWDRKRAGASSETEWEEAKMDDLRVQAFELLRVIPTDEWFKARFIFQNEARQEIGRFERISQYSCRLVIGEKSLDAYIQIWGVPLPERFKGKSNALILIISNDQIISEVRRTRRFPREAFVIMYQGMSVELKRTGMVLNSGGEVFQNGQLIGRYKRPRAASQKVLFAFRRELPVELKVILMYLTLLN